MSLDCPVSSRVYTFNHLNILPGYNVLSFAEILFLLMKTTILGDISKIEIIFILLPCRERLIYASQGIKNQYSLVSLLAQL